MKKYSNYLIITLLLLLLGLTFFNLYRLDNNKIKRETNYLKLAEKFNGLEFSVIKIYNAINDSVIESKIRKGFIILISNSGCNPCQIRELKNLEEFLRVYNKVKDTYAIYVDNYNRIDALRLKKLSAISFPICYFSNDILSENFLTKPFPKIFFIENQKIISTLIPIPDKVSFSEDFYRKIRN
ncbi:MAG: hypothetical protein ACK4R9_12930 [Ignavibacterium sp.]